MLILIRTLMSKYQRFPTSSPGTCRWESLFLKIKIVYEPKQLFFYSLALHHIFNPRFLTVQSKSNCVLVNQALTSLLLAVCVERIADFFFPRVRQPCFSLRVTIWPSVWKYRNFLVQSIYYGRKRFYG